MGCLLLHGIGEYLTIMYFLDMWLQIQLRDGFLGGGVSVGKGSCKISVCGEAEGEWAHGLDHWILCMGWMYRVQVSY